MRRYLFPTLAVPFVLSTCASAQTPATTPPADRQPMATNPFFARSALPFAAPLFDRIHDSDYVPAIERGMAEQRAEVEQIATATAPPTFANTIEALERSGDLLRRAGKVFAAMTQANTNDALQAAETELAPKLAAHGDAIHLDGRLFARIDAIFAQRERLPLDAEQRFLVERVHRDFVRAGAQLSAADKQALAQLNVEESTLTTEFKKRLLAGRNQGAVVVDDAAMLRGLEPGEVEAAAAAAKAQGRAGKWLLALQNTTQQPVLASLQDRALRQRVLAASLQRGAADGDTDTRAIVLRLAALRAQKAKLLGFPDWAAYTLDDQMAGTPAAAIKLMADMVPAATRKARGEIARMQSVIDREPAAFRLAACDWALYAEKVRKADFDLDEAALKPYFELRRVLRDGVFFAAHELYGLSFEERRDIPVYHPDVEVFEVKDADGKPLALYYGDYYQRDSKAGGAWMDSFVDQSRLLGTLPVVFNVCNFAKPAAGQPALLNSDDVSTLFHEFGHALHGMFSAVTYPTFSGTAVPRDYVEFPSQFNEHWMTEPRVFANYARHWQTGEPMPADLVARLKKAKTFNQGFATTEYLAAALLDMAWHSLPAGEVPTDVAAFERDALRRFAIDLPEVPPRYGTTWFAHIWAGGYSAGYYAYLWSEVLDDDAWDWFEENGGLTRANGDRFRAMVLSRGGTMDCAAMFRAFRGRDPSVEPLLRERGLVDAAPAK